MADPVQNVIDALNTFEPDLDADNSYQLAQRLEGLRALPDRARAVPVMFSLIERFPEADFGSPGPLVHELEAIQGYEAELMHSLERQPTALAVWMTNRILNATADRTARPSWLSVLQSVVNHPKASSSVRALAQHFIDYQAKK